MALFLFSGLETFGDHAPEDGTIFTDATDECLLGFGETTAKEFDFDVADTAQDGGDDGGVVGDVGLTDERVRVDSDFFGGDWFAARHL